MSSQALTTLHDNAYNKPKRIPLANDIKCLNAYLTGKASELSATLGRDPDAKTWRGLSEVTLINLEKGNLQHFKGKSLDDIDVVADGMCLRLLLDYPYVPIQN